MKSFFRLTILCAAMFVGCACLIQPPIAQAIAPAPILLSQPVGGTAQVSGLPQYIAVWYRYLIGIASMCAIIVMIYGGFLYLWGAASGSASKGKDMIVNAVLGLVLVYSAYLILHTVNPAALTLQVNGLTNINRVGLIQQLQSADAHPVQENGPHPQCALDAECSATSQHAEAHVACMRVGAVLSGLSHAANEVSPSSGVGAMIRHVSSLSMIIPTNALLMPSDFDRAGDTAAKQGFCSDSGLGSLCRCVGDGCLPFLTDPDVYVGNPRGLSNVSARGGLVSRARAAFNTYETNNHRQGSMPCFGGNTCVWFRANDDDATGWFCQPVHSRTSPSQTEDAVIQAIPGMQAAQQLVQREWNADRVQYQAHGATHVSPDPSDGVRFCVTNDDCAPVHGVCIRTDKEVTAPEGACVPSGGATLGMRCKCSNYGCGAKQGTGENNQGNDVVACAAGLDCQLFTPIPFIKNSIESPLIGFNTDHDPHTVDWYCAPPPSAAPPSTPASTHPAPVTGASPAAPPSGGTPAP